MLPKLDGNKFYYHEVIGFNVFDINKKYIGKLSSINDSVSQPLFIIDLHGVEILIPMIDAFIYLVDRDSKKLILDIPEGLVDLYL
jgi:16S rRNA processing protein RimM